jgi:large subunit ribosomal protein L24
MQYKRKIRKGDFVLVTTGKEKGKTGEVARVDPKENRLIIKGVNLVKKHQKKGKAEGRIIEKEAPIHISNVAFFDQELKAPTKIGFLLKDGIKVRIAKKTKKILPE